MSLRRARTTSEALQGKQDLLRPEGDGDILVWQGTI